MQKRNDNYQNYVLKGEIDKRINYEKMVNNRITEAQQKLDEGLMV